MRTPALAFRYLWSRPLAALLNLLLLTLGLATITFVLVVGEQVQRSFERDLAGIDLVVGAKGSPMQLILAGVFHIDTPPGNIRLDEVQALAKHPQVKTLIPLSLGDSFGGYRIVGTTPHYLQHYGAQLAQGRAWAAPLEAVLGSEVAQATRMQPGAAFVGNHGLGGGSHDHEAMPYRVTGVLARCGCVLDRLVLTSSESVWMVHETPMAMDADDLKALQAEREVTVALIRYATPLAAVSLPRFINGKTGMQAAAPAIEVTRLLRLLGIGSDVLRVLAGVLLLSAALSVFVGLWNAVRERRADLAMLRMLGAPPARVAGLVLAEALWLAALATVLGMLAGHGLAAGVGSLLEAQGSLPIAGWRWAPGEGWIPLAALAVASAAALVPAVGAYRVDVFQLLQSR